MIQSMNVNPDIILAAILAAAGPQLANTPEGRALAAAGFGDTVGRLIEKIARNAAGPAAMDIEESLGMSDI